MNTDLITLSGAAVQNDDRNVISSIGENNERTDRRRPSRNVDRLWMTMW